MPVGWPGGWPGIAQGKSPEKKIKEAWNTDKDALNEAARDLFRAECARHKVAVDEEWFDGVYETILASSKDEDTLIEKIKRMI